MNPHGLVSAVSTVYAGPHARTPADASQAFLRPAVCFLAALILTLPSRSTAQSSTALEIGIVTAFEDESVVQFGMRVTIARNRPGVDFAIATFPEGLFAGVVFLTPDLDLTIPVSIGEESWILPRMGVSALVGYGEGAFGAIPGYNLGIGVLGATSARMGV